MEDKNLSRVAELERENRKLRREIGHLKDAIVQGKIAMVTALNRQKASTFIQRERERYLALLLGNSPSIIFFLNYAGRVEFCTDYFLAKAGLRNVTEVMGHTLPEVLGRFLDGESLAALLKQSANAVTLNAPVSFDITFHFNGSDAGPDAQEDFAGLLVPMKDESEDFGGMMLMLHDVTALKRSREEALLASKAKSDFLSSMSHEIRTPMNAIIGMTELAIRETISAAARDCMLTVKQASINLLSIINDILDISKIEQGRLKVTPTEYSLESLLHDVVNLIRVRISDKPVAFLVRADSRTPRLLFGDETKIRQILVNLLGNAAKFTEAGFVSLAVTCEAIDADTVNLTVEVADSGIGIKQDDLGKIFDAYTQVSQRRGVQTEGTGLGLAITKGMVNAMGGSVSVRSELGKGSVFSVSLPQKTHSRDSLAAVSCLDDKGVLVYGCSKEYDDSVVYALKNLGVRCAFVSDSTAFYGEIMSGRWPIVFAAVELYETVLLVYADTGFSPRTVLLAEYGDSIPDKKMTVLYMPAYSVSIANLLNGTLDSFSYNADAEETAVFTAPDAKVLVVDDIDTNLKVAEGLMRPYLMRIDLRKSGWQAIEAIKVKRYDLVFMDHKMPDMDGVETVRLIRAMGDSDPYYAQVPIVALTANAVSGMEKMFIENGFSGFLSKPIDLSKLKAVLKKWLGVKTSHQAPAGAAAVSAPGAGGWPLIKIDGVSVGQGLAALGGDRELYMETLAVFHRDGLEKTGQIRACLESGDLRLMAVHAHALKSACANIGANDMSEAAKALEAAGEKGDAQHAASNAAVFLPSMTLLLERVNEALAKYNKENKIAADGDAEAIHSGLAVLKAAIAEMDAAAMNSAVKNLQRIALPEEAYAAIGTINDSILMAEYDEAVRLIDAFTGKI